MTFLPYKGVITSKFSHSEVFPFTNMSPTQSNGALTRIQFGEDKNHFYTYAILRFQAHSYELLKILSLGCQPPGRRDQSPVSPWDPLTLTELQIPPAVGAWREMKCLFTEKKPAFSMCIEGFRCCIWEALFSTVYLPTFSELISLGPCSYYTFWIILKTACNVKYFM